MYLERITGPQDLKCLQKAELPLLAEEIRTVLLEKMSHCGGHLGPNFGFVEASIALHYVFNSPNDKMVFDVSHQSYTHKILTDRKNAFIDPEHYKDVTGYTEPKESEHDLFTIGHTSTSISMACGLAKARDLAGRKENIIAVIGDGSLSGGEAYEGLSCGAKLGTNLIVLLNDNNMSISDVNGGLYGHLRNLRDTKGTCPNNIFKAFGYEYIYEENGNDIESMIRTLERVKDIDHPVVVHIHTQKGKGYKPAESNQEDWHWFPPFNKETGEKHRSMAGENYDNLVADYLLEKMKADSKVIAMCAAVPATIGFDKSHREAAGKQFIDVDICEQHLLSMAAGIAKSGGKPIVATFSTFFQRAYDQISQDICINKLPVTILIRNGSVWAGNDVTHLGWFDLALLSNIPNLVFLCPTNCEEYFAMLDWSIDQTRYPVAIRIPRGKVLHSDKPIDKDYSIINKFKVTQEGNKVAILALGDFYQIGEDVALGISKKFNFIPSLINPRYASGLDFSLLESLKDNHHIVITIEDSIVDGGLGQKIASYYGNTDMKVLNYGLKKEFLDGYDAQEVLLSYGISSDQIISEISQILSEK